MASRYLFDPVATANAHDADGFFKTGDIARKVGRYYFILGRQSVDSKSDFPKPHPKFLITFLMIL